MSRNGTNGVPVSGNVVRNVAKPDARILRTRDALGDALVELMQETPFNEITIQQVLDRAGVGRSTFYTHYRDKDDLFLSDVEEFLESFSTMLTRTGAPAQRLAPVTEFFAQVRGQRDLHLALVRSGKADDVRLLGRGIFARAIDERLKLAGLNLPESRRAAHAQVLAGGFFALLDWWLDQGAKTEPAEMDAMFHAMAWNGTSV